MKKTEYKYNLKDLSKRTPFSEDYLRNSLSESLDKNHRNHILSLEQKMLILMVHQVLM